MTIRYRVDKDATVLTVTVNSFQQFVDFLWEMKVGKEKNDPRILRFWSETYQDFLNKPVNTEVKFARYHATWHKPPHHSQRGKSNLIDMLYYGHASTSYNDIFQNAAYNPSKRWKQCVE
ncbi:hypothetical protein MASR2M29_02460 [Spirochaetota bacterium]